MKFIFMPIGIVAGLVAGMAGKKAFEALWALVDDEEPPSAEHDDAPWAKVLVAAALEGAIFSSVRALADRSSRKGFERLTGTWPGEREPDPEP